MGSSPILVIAPCDQLHCLHLYFTACDATHSGLPSDQTMLTYLPGMLHVLQLLCLPMPLTCCSDSCLFRQCVQCQVWMCVMLDLESTCCGHVPFPTPLFRQPSLSSAGTIHSHHRHRCMVECCQRGNAYMQHQRGAHLLLRALLTGPTCIYWVPHPLFVLTRTPPCMICRNL